MRKLLLISMVTLATLIIVSCRFIRENQSGFFRWELHNESAAIIGLTREGKKQEFLVIPSEIEGKRVRLGYPGRPFLGGFIGNVEARGLIESESLRRIYMSPGIVSRHGFFNNMPNLTHIFKSDTSRPSSLALFSRDIRHQEQTIDFVSNHFWKNFLNQPSFDGVTVPRGMNPVGGVQLRVANVEFVYNFEEAPNNNVFFIDDWQGELIRFRPNDPTRKGYRFEGWYREPEGITKWNFDEDKVPKTEPGNFQIMRLYARWEAN